jgi:autotransporter-associated beta strand protein
MLGYPSLPALTLPKSNARFFIMLSLLSPRLPFASRLLTGLSVLYFACCLGGSLHAQTTVNTDVGGGATITITEPVMNYTTQYQTVNIIGAGTLTITGNGTLAMSEAQGITNFNMTGGQIIIESGSTLRNGGWNGAVWTNNKASMNLAGGGTFDVWQGNPVIIDALTGSGLINATLNTNEHQYLTLGVNNGSGTFTGQITSGSAPLFVTKIGNGTQTLTGTNTYNRTTTISGGTLEIGSGGSLTATTNVTVNTGGTFLLSGAGEQVNNSATMTLAGGTIQTNGASSISETVGALTLSSSSTIDFGTLAGGNTLSFANSSAASWTGTLNVWNWTSGTDHLFFGTSSLGLTSGQLSQINLYSDSGTTLAGAASLGASGEISAVPEPSSMLGALSLLGLAAYRERRWFLRCQEARTPRVV